MKVRISDQSLRLRLSAHEAMELEQQASISTSLRLNTIDTFTIEIRSWNLIIGEAQSEKNRLIVSIPNEAVKELTHKPGFVFHCEQEVGTLPPLSIEVEIDLQKAKHA